MLEELVEHWDREEGPLRVLVEFVFCHPVNSESLLVAVSSEQRERVKDELIVCNLVALGAKPCPLIVYQRQQEDGELLPVCVAQARPYVLELLLGESQEVRPNFSQVFNLL